VDFETDVERAATLTRGEPLVLISNRSIGREDVPSLITDNRLYGLALPPCAQTIREKLRELLSFHEDRNLPRELRITAIQTPVAMGRPMGGINAIVWLCGYDRGDNVYTVIGEVTFIFERPNQVEVRFLTKEERMTLSRLFLTHLA